MKRTIFTFLVIAFSSATIVSAHGQVVASATERVFTVRAGGLFSAFQPDYNGTPFAGGSPQWLYGIGAYVDARLNRWVQPEVEMRWGLFNKYNPDPIDPASQPISQNTYSIGERVPITTTHKFTPYGKVLVGFGNGSFLSGNALVMTYGGGVDYKLNRKFTIRACDFEYQQWSVTPSAIHPYGFSGGVSYRIF